MNHLAAMLTASRNRTIFQPMPSSGNGLIRRAWSINSITMIGKGIRTVFPPSPRFPNHSAHSECTIVALSRRPFTTTPQQRLEPSHSKLSFLDTSAKRPIHFRFTAGSVAVLVVATTLGARWAYRQVVTVHPLPPSQDAPHDQSRATVLLQRITTNRIPTADDNDVSHRPVAYQQVDASEWKTFLQQQRAQLAKAAQQHGQEAAQSLHEQLEQILLLDEFAVTRQKRFVDWYLAYPTTYQLMRLALSSAAKHMAQGLWNGSVVDDDQERTLTAKVSQDLQTFVGQKYQVMVLKPALTDARIQQALVQSIKQGHQGYLDALEQLDESLASFVKKHAKPYYAKAPTPKDVVVQLDWAHQRRKAHDLALVYEKGGARTVGLVTIGAAAGKMAAGTTTTLAAMKAAVAGSGGSTSGSQALLAKLVTPFASKAAATTVAGKSAGTAAAAAGAGGVLGGPLGGLVGAILGIGVDMTVNAGVGLWQRSALERDVQEAIQATIVEWEEGILRPELERVQSVWYDHAIEILRENDEKLETN